MNANKTNTGMNVDDYENLAVQNSNVAKRVAVGSAVFLGGAAVAGGAAYAANHAENTETPLTEDDLLSGAEVGSDYAPVEETTTAATTTEQVVVEKPVVVTESEDTANPEITWDETTNYYAGDEKAMSIEQGTVDGHKFALIDVDGDEHADYLVVDMNDNGKIDEGEVVQYSHSDHVHMGHSTAHVTDHHYDGGFDINGNNDPNLVARNNIGIHNDFEDEKTGESYYGDFAENNPDYNSRASLNDFDNTGSVAENEISQGPTADGMDDIHNDANDLAQNDTVVEEETDEPDAYDSMMGGEEFLA